MFCFVGLCFGMLVRLFRERRSLLLENLALRQQLVALKRRHPRPCLGVFDKFFWVIARRVCSAWKQSLLIVTPETVVSWHRTDFCMKYDVERATCKETSSVTAPSESLYTYIKDQRSLPILYLTVSMRLRILAITFIGAS